MSKDVIEVIGMKSLKKDMDKFPHNVQRKAGNKGLMKAAGKLRTYLRRAAPKQSGELRRSIGLLRTRGRKREGYQKVGLKTRYYYKTLEFPFTRRGTTYSNGLRPFFEATTEVHAKELLQMIITETERGLYEEWGRLAARNQRR